MAERPNAPVLKTGDPRGSGGSNPSPSATPPGPALHGPGPTLECPGSPTVERWPSGRRRQIANLLWDYLVPPRVRIPASPPLFCLLLLLAGCGTHHTTITSSPADSPCYIDGRLRGTTPLETTSRWPGYRRIEVIKENHQLRETRVDLRPSPPTWLFPLDFPWDLLRQLLGPGERRVHLRLPPAAAGEAPLPDRTELLRTCRRAASLAARRVH